MAGKKISELQALTTLTGEEELPVAINGDNRKVTSSLLVEGIKTAQSGLLARVNDYMYDMSGLLGKLAVRDGAGTDLKNLQQGHVFNINGELVGNQGFYQYINIEDTKIYYLKLLGSGSANYELCLFDHNDKLIKSIGDPTNGYFIFVGVAKIGVCSGIESLANAMIIKSFDIQDLTTVLNTQQGNRALYVAAGAVYNQNTGFYELNGLTDITEGQMKVIYVQTNPTKRVTDLCSVLNASSIRTNLPFLNRGGYKLIDCYAAFVNCRNLEVVALGVKDGVIFYPARIPYMFYNCIKLRTVIGALDCGNTKQPNDKAFDNCRALENIRLNKLKYSISFGNSPLLSLKSMQYLITNAANTSPITVTVHADVYAKIQDEGQVDWHALIETAAAKQITFATA